LSATELLRTESTFQQCIDYVDIARRSFARSLQSKYSEQKWRFSTSMCENISSCWRCECDCEECKWGV